MWDIFISYVAQVIGPDHDKRFTVEVMMDDKVIGVGTGGATKGRPPWSSRRQL